MTPIFLPARSISELPPVDFLTSRPVPSTNVSD